MNTATRDMPDPEGGLTIDQALKSFTSPALRYCLGQAEDACPPPWDADMVRGLAGGRTHAPTARDVAYGELAEARRLVKDDLIARLASGELVGFVFPHPIPPAGERIRVDADRWQHARFAGIGNVRIDGVKYKDLRIWRSADLDAHRPRVVYYSGKAVTDCERWLRDTVERGGPEKPKALYKAEAIKLFEGLSGRGFDRAWDMATDGNDDWRRPGRKKY
jgi:hypothetical protein